MSSKAAEDYTGTIVKTGKAHRSEMYSTHGLCVAIDAQVRHRK